MKKAGLFEIFIIFLKIGMQLLGGGYVIVPLLKKYIVEQKSWLTEEELVDYFAMSQCIPGIIACNITILAGRRAAGIPGAIVAAMGIILPPFFAILILANMLKEIIHYEIIQNMFWGIRISVIVMIILTVRDIWKSSINSVFTAGFFVTVLFTFLFLSVSPALIIILSGVVAIIYSAIKRRKNA